METKIDKSKTALVVIDLQKGITAMPAQPHDAKTVISNAAQLAEAFRKNGMPVFLVRVAPAADGKDALHPLVDGANPWGNAPRPADWTELVPEMAPQTGDFVVTKKQWGAFYGTDLDLQLRRRQIDTIVLCGIATNIGVESTARFAYEYGYQQIFAEDACASMSAEAHNNSVSVIFPRIGKVRATADILAAL
ncbi:MAG TPA: hydrolase [Patescibacteria group bacterium]|nr:hydrolase [Patescibacteria group bacterium]